MQIRIQAAGGVSGFSLEAMEKIVQESNIIALFIAHLTAHAGETFAEAKVVSWIGFGRLALGPVPLATVLDINDVDRVA